MESLAINSLVEPPGAMPVPLSRLQQLVNSDMFTIRQGLDAARFCQMAVTLSLARPICPQGPQKRIQGPTGGKPVLLSDPAG